MLKNSEKDMTTEKKTVNKTGIPNQEDSKTKDIKKKSPKISIRGKSKEKELAKTKEELAEVKDKYLRLYSEFDNFRRRTAKEKLELVSTANEDLMIELLPVLDDFERGLKAMETENSDNEGLMEGIMLIYNKFKNVIDKKGLKLMETNPGDDFNSEIHDAITQIPAPEEKLKGKIVDTVEKGYYLNEKVIRYAKVVTGA
jgi:molecular chaperone GrpE